jgi:hypothetical protein
MSPSEREDKQPNPDNEDYLSAKDMRQWAEREMGNARRAFELRTKELRDLATSYSAGQITPERADELHSRYHHRWGEALPGVTAAESMSDEDVLATVDKSLTPFVGPKESRELYRKLFQKPNFRQ